MSNFGIALAGGMAVARERGGRPDQPFLSEDMDLEGSWLGELGK